MRGRLILPVLVALAAAEMAAALAQLMQPRGLTDLVAAAAAVFFRERLGVAVS